MQAIGYNAVLKKKTLEESTGGVILKGRTVYTVTSIGKDLEADVLEVGKDVVIRPGTEGEPILKKGNTFYVVHIDNIMAYD